MAHEDWYSTWQTNDDKHDYAWASEKVGFDYGTDGHFAFSQTEENTFGYKWSGEGWIHRESYMSGKWSSDHANAKAAGVFILHDADTQGNVRSGFLLGPDTEYRKNFGAWVLVKEVAYKKNSKLIEQAKRRLALDMCPGLGDLIELSDGQFLAKFLHPEIQKSALSDLRQRRRRSAVRNAFQELITHVQTVSGLPSSLSPGDLMTAAFEPQKGKLSNGKISNQQASNFEFGKQLNMQQLFQGSLYIRNLYVHDIPAPKFSEAVQLLMLASYLFGVVDEQRAKGIT